MPNYAADDAETIRRRMDEIAAEREALRNRRPGAGEQCPVCGVGVLQAALGGLRCEGCGEVIGT